MVGARCVALSSTFPHSPSTLAARLLAVLLVIFWLCLLIVFGHILGNDCAQNISGALAGNDFGAVSVEPKCLQVGFQIAKQQHDEAVKLDLYEQPAATFFWPLFLSLPTV
jgi:hypothetical protein